MQSEGTCRNPQPADVPARKQCAITHQIRHRGTHPRRPRPCLSVPRELPVARSRGQWGLRLLRSRCSSLRLPLPATSSRSQLSPKRPVVWGVWKAHVHIQHPPPVIPDPHTMECVIAHWKTGNVPTTARQRRWRECVCAPSHPPPGRLHAAPTWARAPAHARLHRVHPVTVDRLYVSASEVNVQVQILATRPLICLLSVNKAQ